MYRPGVHRLRLKPSTLAVILIIGACGGSGSDPTGVATTVGPPDTTSPTSSGGPTTTTGAAPGGSGSPAGGECTVVVTGDREDTWTFEQSVYSVGSDYWMDEQELRDTVEYLGEDIAGGTYDEIVGRSEPIVTFLSVSCVDADDVGRGASITHTNATHRTDLPMGPGSYPIIGGVFDANGPAATMIASLGVGTDEVYGTVPESGSLEITRWDLERIEGSFSFQAVEGLVDQPQEVSVTVEFSFVCDGWFGGC